MHVALKTFLQKAFVPMTFIQLYQIVFVLIVFVLIAFVIVFVMIEFVLIVFVLIAFVLTTFCHKMFGQPKGTKSFCKMFGVRTKFFRTKFFRTKLSAPFFIFGLDFKRKTEKSFFNTLHQSYKNYFRKLRLK
jgi:hypothetical protein